MLVGGRGPGVVLGEWSDDGAGSQRVLAIIDPDAAERRPESSLGHRARRGLRALLPGLRYSDAGGETEDWFNPPA